MQHGTTEVATNLEHIKNKLVICKPTAGHSESDSTMPKNIESDTGKRNPAKKILLLGNSHMKGVPRCEYC